MQASIIQKEGGKVFLRSEGINKCTEKNCDYASDYKESVKAHIEWEHNGILRFKCNICDYKSYFKHLVKRHQKTSSHSGKNNGVLRIGCIFCEEDILHTEHSNSVRKERKARRGVKGNLKPQTPGSLRCLNFRQSHKTI